MFYIAYIKLPMSFFPSGNYSHKMVLIVPGYHFAICMTIILFIVYTIGFRSEKINMQQAKVPVLCNF